MDRNADTGLFVKAIDPARLDVVYGTAATVTAISFGHSTHRPGRTAALLPALRRAG
jgi:hypothetical protein